VSGDSKVAGSSVVSGTGKGSGNETLDKLEENLQVMFPGETRHQSTVLSRVRKFRVPVSPDLEEIAKILGVNAYESKGWSCNAMQIALMRTFVDALGLFYSNSCVTEDNLYPCMSLTPNMLDAVRFVFSSGDKTKDYTKGTRPIEHPLNVSSQYGYCIQPNVNHMFGIQHGVAWLKRGDGLALYTQGERFEYILPLYEEGPNFQAIATYGIFTLYKIGTGAKTRRELHIPPVISEAAAISLHKNASDELRKDLFRNMRRNLKGLKGFEELVSYSEWGPVAAEALCKGYLISQAITSDLVTQMRDYTKTTQYTRTVEASEQIGLLSPAEELMRYARYHWKDMLSDATRILVPLVSTAALAGHFVTPLAALAMGGFAALGAAALFAPQIVAGPIRAGLNCIRDYWMQHGQESARVGEKHPEFPSVVTTSEDGDKTMDANLEVSGDICHENVGNQVAYVDLYQTTNLPYTHYEDSVTAMVSTLDVRFPAPVLPVDEQKEAWDNSPVITGLLAHVARHGGDEFTADDVEVRQNWEDHLEPQKHQLYKSSAQRYDRETCVKRVNIMLKMGEVYFIQPDGAQKARVIANVCPAFQYHVGPAVYEVTKRLKSLFAVDNVGIPGYEYRLDDGRKVWLTYGAGLTSKQLNAWFAHVIENPCDSYVIAAGDDSVVYDARDGTFYCSDFSSFDQSESKGPLQFQYKLFRLLGMCDDDIEMLKKLHSAPLAYQNRWLRKNRPWVENYLKIYHGGRPFRMSGGPDTTVGNTAVSLASWLHVLSGEVTEQAFKNLGFKVKLNGTKDPGQCLFLRGRWLHLSSGFYWTPCLGKIPRLGKTKANLQLLFPDAANEEERRSLYLAQLAESVRGASWNPVWKVWVDTFGIEDTKLHDDIRISRKYDIVMDDVPPDASDVEQVLCEVYDIDQSILTEMKEDIKRAEGTKWLCSWVWEHIHNSDYA
jgi:hypothetical protein